MKILAFTVLLLASVASTQAQSCPDGTGVIEIAGSSTVFPVAEQWAELMQDNCPSWTVNVRGGGSSAGQRQVCNVPGDSTESAVDIGNMSREWRSGEATTPNFDWLYHCTGSDRKAIQILVGFDGLSLAVAVGSAAEQCLSNLPGLTLNQIRWMFSSLTEQELAQTGWTNDLQGTSQGNVNRRTWRELGGTNCLDEDIVISGADVESGTQEYFIDTIFNSDSETFANRTDGYFNSEEDEDIVAYLGQQTYAIGYFGYAYAKESAGSISTVAIRNSNGRYVKPTSETISAKEYEPFSRPIYMNVLDNPAVLEKAGAFLAFGFSSAGDRLVDDVGYVPTTLAERKIGLTRLGAEGGVKRDDVEAYCPPSNGDFVIAGSSTVFPVANLWAGVYQVFCKNVKIDVFGGGSSVGACRVCDQCTDDQADEEGNIPGPSDIGDMSREWRIGREVTTENDWEYSCVDSSREVAQVEVAIDGLSVVTSLTGPAHDCIIALGGLTKDQLRWIYSNLGRQELIDDGWNENSVPHHDNDDNTHLWSELSTDQRCRDIEIKISGADDLSGTYDYMAEFLFNDDLDEIFDSNRPNDPSYFSSERDEEVVEYLDMHEDAIGYFGYAYVARNTDSLDPVAIRNDLLGSFVVPEPASIAGGDYPIARRIYMNVWDNAAANALTLPFMEFGLSPAGQSLVEDTGYSAIPEWENIVMHARIETDFSKDKSVKEWLKSEGAQCATGDISIAGSSTVRPVADIWAGMFEVGCDIKIEVEGGGSGAGAARVCANNVAGLGSAVDIGDMSREWKTTEAKLVGGDCYYRCVAGDSTRHVIQVQVATDGLTVASRTGGIADECIKTMGGLTISQLRWIYSSLSVEELEADGWDRSSVPNLDNDDTTHLWSELNDDCPSTEIKISGADPVSGTYDYFFDVVFSAQGETFDLDRPNAPYVNNAADEVLVQYLEEESAAISYFGYTYFFSRSDILSAAPIRNPAGDYIPPNANTIGLGTYSPFSRPIYMNLLSSDTEAFANTEKLIKFGLSNYGAKLVETTGYVPVTDYPRARELECLKFHSPLEGVYFDEDQLSGGAIAGIFLAGIAAILFLVTLMCIKAKKTKQPDADPQEFSTTGERV